MIVVGVLFLILFPVSLIGYGAVLTWNYPVMKKRGLLTSYLAGFFVLLAIFTIFSISFTILDRPFLYAIMDTETGLPVFIGTVCDPSVK